MKKIFFLLMIIIIIITISIKVNYKAHITLVFGNNIKGNYVYQYNNTRLLDIINDIKNNIKINDRYLQNILVKSDMIYLDLNNIDINKNNFMDINKLLETIRNYTKEKLIIVLREENNSNDKMINKWIFHFKNKYDIIIKR